MSSYQFYNKMIHQFHFYIFFGHIFLYSDVLQTQTKSTMF